LNELHAFVCDLARRAGEIQLSRVDRPGEVREKAPKDIVTEVDLLCEEMMVSRIAERYPQDSILGEESGGEVSPTGRTWLLDPVDGTANFSRANPLYCACVSVVENGAVIHAAVAVPRLGDLYHAELGEGAFVTRDDGASRSLRVSDTRRLEYGFVGADLAFVGPGGDPPTGGAARVFAAAWQLRALGSAGVRGAWVAAGYLDISIGTRPTVWDYAPTALLVAEAGGRSTDLSGNPWQLDSDGLIATNGHLHDEVLSAFRGS
jgi:fructose-1,6-bisphosphatase/inositol monophosphatase family enzyme